VGDGVLAADRGADAHRIVAVERDRDAVCDELPDRVRLVRGHGPQDDVAGQRALDGDPTPGQLFQEPGIGGGIDGVPDPRQAGRAQRCSDVGGRELASVHGDAQPRAGSARGHSVGDRPQRWVGLPVVRIDAKIHATQPGIRHVQARLELALDSADLGRVVHQSQVADRLGAEPWVPRPDAPLCLSEQRQEIGPQECLSARAKAHLDQHRPICRILFQQVGHLVDNIFRGVAGQAAEVKRGVRRVHCAQAVRPWRHLGEPARRRPPVIRLPPLATGDDALEARYFFLVHVQVGLGQ
jgi:hypothetical protein